MKVVHAHVAGTVLALLAAAAGCGGDGGDGEATTASPTARQAERGLPRPLHLRCEVEGFTAPPRVREFEGSGNIGQAWSLQYTRAQAPDQAGASRPTNTVLVVQSAPTARRAKRQPRTKDLVVAGRRVQWRGPAKQFGTYSAQWSTSRALYTAIATGSTPTTLRRFIACLP